MRPDLVLTAEWEGKKHSFIVEFKGTSTPKVLEASIQQARRYAAGGMYLPMVIVPYLSPTALDRLAEEKVSGIDLSGNGLVVVPGEWFVRNTGEKNRFPAGTPIKNVYRASDITRRRRVKVPDRWRTLRQFAQNAQEYGVSIVGDLPSRYVIMPESEDSMRIYATSIESMTQSVELEDTSRFPNMELIETRDQTVYFDPSTENQFPFISPLQTYLMLAAGGKREQEAAAQLRPDLVAANQEPEQTAR